MTNTSKRPKTAASKPNRLTIDLDHTRRLYREDKDGGVFALDPVDDRMTHIHEADASEIACAAAVGIAFINLLPSGWRDHVYEVDRLQELLDRVFPSEAPYALQAALANVGAAFSEMGDRRLRQLQSRALKAAAATAA